MVSAARLGIARLPDFLCGAGIRDGLLDTVCSDWLESPTGIWAVYPPSRFLSSKVRVFIDDLAARFEHEPPGPAAA